jgi:hypothetical protein
MLKRCSPDAAFHYISGRGTNSASRMFWAQVKAQVESDLIQLIGADCWRAAFIDAKPSASMPKMYSWFVPLGRLFQSFPNFYVRGTDIGRAMLQASIEKIRGRVIENAEIREIASRATF